MYISCSQRELYILSQIAGSAQELNMPAFVMADLYEIKLLAGLQQMQI